MSPRRFGEPRAVPSGYGPPLIRPGDRVALVQASDIEGLVISEKRFLDDSRRWEVVYWLDGERKIVEVDRWEMEIVTRIEDVLDDDPPTGAAKS